MKNADGTIPDGITAEVMLSLVPTPLTRVPRSALTFSSAATSACAPLADDGTVQFHPVSVHEDEQTFMWLDGVPQGARVIVQGQDFVREGQRVDAVPAQANTATR